MLNPPHTLAELMHRCRHLAGLTLGEVAAEFQQPVPSDLRKDKGWVGQMMEYALGANAGSQALPDFPELGVELKTLPISAHGKPLESTYVCVAPLTGITGQRWQESWVCQKLQCVLWLPVLAERHIPIEERVIGQGFLWQPNTLQSAQLQQDWEELMELITLGGINKIRGAHGKVLQLRPKAADSRALTKAVGARGEPITTLPRGFYLKSSFTYEILQQQFRLM